MTLVTARYLTPATNVEIIDPYDSNALRYSSSTQRYTMLATDNLLFPTVDESTTFDPANIVTTRSNATRTVFQITCGTSFPQFQYQLNLFNPGAENPELKLTYGSFGEFQFYRPSGFLGNYDSRLFAYGHVTSAAGINRTGTATYDGVTRGIALQSGVNKVEFTVAGTIRLTVNFDNKTFSGTVTLTATRKGGGGTAAPINLGTTRFAQHNGAALSRLAASFEGSGAGNLRGFLAGPAAEELALSLRLTMVNPDDVYGGSMDIIASGAAKR